MGYDSLVSGADAAALIPEEVSKDIMKGIMAKSAALQLFQHRKMRRHQQRIPCVSFLPTAYFVNGRTGLKQTSEVNWANKYLDAEEIATIIPVPESLLADVDYPLWDEMKPLLEEAVAVCLDDAVFFGINAPSSWPDDIKKAATAANNSITYAHNSTDVADNLSEIMGLVEVDGFVPNGFWCHMAVKGLLRGLRTTAGDFIFHKDGTTTFQGQNRDEATVFNEKAYFSRSGLSSMGTSAGGVMAIGQSIRFCLRMMMVSSTRFRFVQALSTPAA